MNKYIIILISIFGAYFCTRCKNESTPIQRSTNYLNIQVLTEFNYTQGGTDRAFAEAFLPPLEHDTVLFETKNGLIKLYIANGRLYCFYTFGSC